MNTQANLRNTIVADGTRRLATTCCSQLTPPSRGYPAAGPACMLHVYIAHTQQVIKKKNSNVYCTKHAAPECTPTSSRSRSHYATALHGVCALATFQQMTRQTSECVGMRHASCRMPRGGGVGRVWLERSPSELSLGPSLRPWVHDGHSNTVHELVSGLTCHCPGSLESGTVMDVTEDYSGQNEKSTPLIPPCLVTLIQVWFCQCALFFFNAIYSHVVFLSKGRSNF